MLLPEEVLNIFSNGQWARYKSDMQSLTLKQLPKYLYPSNVTLRITKSFLSMMAPLTIPGSTC